MMEQRQQAPYASTAPDVIDRLARLEMATIYERRERETSLSTMSSRVSALERASRRKEAPIDSIGWTKLAIALALPAAVLILTGNVKAAVATLQMISP